MELGLKKRGLRSSICARASSETCPEATCSLRWRPEPLGSGPHQGAGLPAAHVHVCTRPRLCGVCGAPPGPACGRQQPCLLQVYLLILSVTTLSLLLAPVLWRAVLTRCVPRPERRSSP